MIKNIKLKVETDDENQYVLHKLLDVNKDFAWFINLFTGNGFWLSQDNTYRAVCSVWKGFKFLVINEVGDLILCVHEEYYFSKKEKEITFQEFKAMCEPKKTLWDKREEGGFGNNNRESSFMESDIKEALKEFIGEVSESKQHREEVVEIAKEIFGEEML